MIDSRHVNWVGEREFWEKTYKRLDFLISYNKEVFILCL